MARNYCQVATLSQFKPQQYVANIENLKDNAGVILSPEETKPEFILSPFIYLLSDIIIQKLYKTQKHVVMDTDTVVF